MEAIIVLIVAQVLAQLVASLFVLVKVPEGICNIIAGIIYVGLAFALLKLFSKKLLKIKMDNLGMPRFLSKAKSDFFNTEYWYCFYRHSCWFC